MNRKITARRDVLYPFFSFHFHFQFLSPLLHPSPMPKYSSVVEAAWDSSPSAQVVAAPQVFLFFLVLVAQDTAPEIPPSWAHPDTENAEVPPFSEWFKS
jgi:hypothetical protein